MFSVSQLPYKEWGILKKNVVWQFFCGSQDDIYLCLFGFAF